MLRDRYFAQSGLNKSNLDVSKAVSHFLNSELHLVVQASRNATLNTFNLGYRLEK